MLLFNLMRCDSRQENKSEYRSFIPSSCHMFDDMEGPCFEKSLCVP